MVACLAHLWLSFNFQGVAIVATKVGLWGWKKTGGYVFDDPEPSLKPPLALSSVVAFAFVITQCILTPAIVWKLRVSCVY